MIAVLIMASNPYNKDCDRDHGWSPYMGDSPKKRTATMSTATTQFSESRSYETLRSQS